MPRLFDAAEGMSSSVDCRDLFHDVSTDDVRQVVDANANFGFLYNTGFYGTACEEWNAGEVDPSFNEPVTADIPTLVLAGRFDPVTPPDDSKRVADHLDNATYVEFDGTGHGVFRAHECAQRRTVEFINDPTAPLDTQCATEIGPPDFPVP